jgi:CubicO group peptidase (beta-lactamase class C family)
MRISARALSTIILAGALELVSVTGASTAEWSSEKSSRVDALIAHFLRPQRQDGAAPPEALSLAIGVDGRLVFANGYGEATPSSKATKETVYHIGSLTKQFTAAAMLHLIEEGAEAPLSGAAMTLDTPMQAIFEGVDNWTADGEPQITVRNLLTMTSNLPNFTRRPPPNVDPWGAVPAPRLLHELKKLSPHGWPNSFEYSNTGYFLLAQIIETVNLANHASAGSYRDLVRAVIIDRAGMTQTGFVGDYAPGSELAKPHYRRRPAFTKPAWLNGCGDMASNVVDLFRWNSALMHGRVIGWKSLSSMFSDGARVGPTRYYGMGWFIDHEDKWDTFSHSGSVPGFTSYNAIRKRQLSASWLSVTLLTNSDGVEGLDELADDLFDVARAE